MLKRKLLARMKEERKMILEQIRCPNPQCNRRLVDMKGQAQIRCPKCKALVEIDTDARKIYIRKESVKKVERQ
jgi:phage FluMu protein Com